MAKKRMAICENCAKFDEKFKRCKECGCFMVAKTQIPMAECPLNKW